MRSKSLLAYLCLSATLLAPRFLHAQFQEPTKEELQMTDDSKSPGAAAVYLNIVEETNDPMHYDAFYVRVKVLHEKGKELATVTIPYQHGDFKVTDIKGRTIHADGTVIPLTIKPEDLLSSEEDGNQVRQIVFTLPAVDVGSILEYRYRLRTKGFSAPLWKLQREYFVHQAHYSFTPFGGGNSHENNNSGEVLVDSHGNAMRSLIFLRRLPPGVDLRLDLDYRYTLDVSDIPPIPNEDFMPPVDSFLYHVLFYYESDRDSVSFWQRELKQWAKDVDHFAEPTKPIREAVMQLTAPGDSGLDKARKLYKAVQALENTDYSRKRDAVELKAHGLHAAKRAEDTWSQKSGSREDIALLYLAMSRAAGLQAWEVKVVDRARGIFSSDYLSFDQFDDDIVILSIEDKKFLVDPGEKMCPFGMLSWRHLGAGAVAETADGPTPGESPLDIYTNEEVRRTGTVYLDEHGGMTGSLRFLMKGQEAIYWRQQALLNDPDDVKKQFDRMLKSLLPEGVNANIDHFIGLDDPEVNLIAVISAKGTIGTLTAKRLLIPGFFLESRGHRSFVDQPHRQTMVDMHYAEEVTDQIVYQFPDSFKVEGIPQDASIQFASNAVLHTKVTQGPGQVNIARVFERSFTFLKPEQYQDLRAFYQKVDANDQEQVVLLIGTEKNGN